MSIIVHKTQVNKGCFFYNFSSKTHIYLCIYLIYLVYPKHNFLH